MSAALNKWIKEMRRKCPNPKEGQIVQCQNQLYERVRSTEGKHLWRKLKADEVITLFMKQTGGDEDPHTWVQNFAHMYGVDKNTLEE